MSKKLEQNPKFEQDINNAVIETENFVEKNLNTILTVVGVVVLLVVGYILLNNYYFQPREVKAQNDLYQEEMYFAQDSFAIALNGDDINYGGFLEIIDEYGRTKAGNLAKAYAGISYYKLGDYEQAVNYLSKFDSDDKMAAPAIVGLIGDCYTEMGDVEKGIKYYLKAGKEKNGVLSPIFLRKAGISYESLGQYDKAIDIYNEIKKDYSTESNNQVVIEIDSYIEHAKTMK